MQMGLRSCGRLAKGLLCQTPSRCGAAVGASEAPLLHSTHKPFWNFVTVRLCQRRKDYALPNSSWSSDMIRQYEKLTELSKDGKWIRMPSRRHLEDDMADWLGQDYEELYNKNARLFTRNFDSEGLGFEYAVFLNPSEKRTICLFQPGFYLEGQRGFAHGGAIATILDNSIVITAASVIGSGFTAVLNINFKRPVPLGSVVLVDSKIDKIEGKKVFLSAQVLPIDGQNVHTEATGLYIKLQSIKSTLQ